MNNFTDSPSSLVDSETVMRIDELDATIQMMLFTDHSYTKPYNAAPTIELGHKVGKRDHWLFEQGMCDSNHYTTTP